MIKIIEHPNGTHSVILTEEEILHNTPTEVLDICDECVPEVDVPSLYSPEVAIEFKNVQCEIE